MAKDTSSLLSKIEIPKSKTYLDRYGHLYRDGNFACNKCHGSGRVVAPGEVPDVYEGHKLSKRITCPRCGGSKFLPESFYKNLARSENRAVRERANDLRRKKKIIRDAVKKLTQEEYDILVSAARGYL